MDKALQQNEQKHPILVLLTHSENEDFLHYKSKDSRAWFIRPYTIFI